MQGNLSLPPDLAAIARVLNYLLRPRGVVVIVKPGQQGTRILLVAQRPLNPEICLRVVQQGLSHLPRRTEEMWLCGWIQGSRQLSWVRSLQPSSRVVPDLYRSAVFSKGRSAQIPVLHSFKRWVMGATLCGLAGMLGVRLGLQQFPTEEQKQAPQKLTPAPSTALTKAPPPPVPTPLPTPTPPYVMASAVGQAWGDHPGLLQFRGNPTRTWYGTGPIPQDPRLLWSYPSRPLCGTSQVGSEVRTWCGTGWTGQPAIQVRADGVQEVIVGTYDHAVHFINLETGAQTRSPFQTGDIIKGSVSLDPEGYPLLYFGSRDNQLRIVALDRDTPEQLWALDGNISGAVWNNDWDGNPVILGDWLIQGGENSWLFIIKLNRGFDDQGQITVKPEVVFSMPGFTQGLFDRIGDTNVSIENSVAIYQDRLYFANSGGRVVGINLTKALTGTPWPDTIEFDFWTGDDVDATIVIDQLGFLYVAVEQERFDHPPAYQRSQQVGQLLKLDPSQTGDEALLWSVAVPPRAPEDKGGIWATPALYRDHLYVSTHPGELLVVDTASGEVTWRTELGWHSWSSPVVVSDQLIVANCQGQVRNYDLKDPAVPVLQWIYTLPSQGCIESTPAVWNGRIVFGSRDGFIYALGEIP